MQIEVWADITCPWCGLGNYRLGQALARFEQAEDVQVVHRSFQLAPDFPTEATQSVRAMLRSRYDMSDEEIERSNLHLEEIAAAEGLSPYIVLNNEVGNTALAHELLAFASDRGLHKEAWSRLFQAHFGERISVFDLESLVKIGVDIGLSEESVRTVLSSRIYAQQVEDEADIAKELGAKGVPFFVFDRRFAVEGAHSADALLEVLEKAYSEFRVVREAYAHTHSDDQ